MVRTQPLCQSQQQLPAPGMYPLKSKIYLMNPRYSPQPNLSLKREKQSVCPHSTSVLARQPSTQGTVVQDCCFLLLRTLALHATDWATFLSAQSTRHVGVSMSSIPCTPASYDFHRSCKVSYPCSMCNVETSRHKCGLHLLEEEQVHALATDADLPGETKHSLMYMQAG